MKKSFVCGILTVIAFMPVTYASDLPKLQIKAVPESQPSNVVQNVYSSDNNSYGHCIYCNNCFYSTTMTTKELRARRKAINEARRNNKNCRKFKCKDATCQDIKCKDKEN